MAEAAIEDLEHSFLYHVEQSSCSYRFTLVPVGLQNGHAKRIVLRSFNVVSTARGTDSILVLKGIARLASQIQGYNIRIQIPSEFDPHSITYKFDEAGSLLLDFKLGETNENY